MRVDASAVLIPDIFSYHWFSMKGEKGEGGYWGPSDKAQRVPAAAGQDVASGTLYQMLSRSVLQVGQHIQKQAKIGVTFVQQFIHHVLSSKLCFALLWA